VYSTGAFIPVLQAGQSRDSGIWMGSLLTNTLWLSIYCISLYLLCKNFDAPFEQVKGNWVILVLLGLAFASIIWSEVPLLTALRCGTLLGTVIISLYISCRYGTRELMNLSAWALGIAGACSAFFIIFFPRAGIGSGDFEGDWLGIYGQKNNLGGAMSLGFLVFVLLFRFTRPRRYRYLFLAVFMLALVLGSNSTSSMVVCAALPAILWITRATLVPSPSLTWRRIGIMVLAVSLAWMIVPNFEQVTNALDRDVTLTGRTVMWGLVYQAIQEKPLLGYGYESFWRGDEGLGGEIWGKVGQNLFYSHNGFLEIWLGLGLVGVLAFTSAFVFSIVMALYFIRKRFFLYTVWPWLLLCYLFLSNLTEASFMRANTLPWILFLIVVIDFSKDLSRVPSLRGLELSLKTASLEERDVE
jgi:O-antigen ligase